MSLGIFPKKTTFGRRTKKKILRTFFTEDSIREKKILFSFSFHLLFLNGVLYNIIVKEKVKMSEYDNDIYDECDYYEEYYGDELLSDYIYMFGEPYDPIWDMYIDDFEDYEF